MGQKTIANLTSEYSFVIPNYQRDYAWKKENVDDLWEDLLEAKNDEIEHFLGTIVVSKNQNHYEIIDGQQRLTTIFMLKFALNEKTQNPNFNKNHFYDMQGNLKFKVTKINKEFFNKILKQAENSQINLNLKNEAKTAGHLNLYESFSRIWDYVGNLDTKQAYEFWDILNNMVVMWLEEKSSGRAIRMFQTVNDRGVPLLLLDKLKALLILYSNKYTNGKLDEIINERFGQIFTIMAKISNHEVSSSLSDKFFKNEVELRVFNYHAMSNKKFEIGHYTYGGQNAYEKLKNILKEKVKNQSVNLEAWIDEYSKDLLAFCEAFLEVLNRANHEESIFKMLYVLKINAYFYASIIRLHMNSLLDDEMVELLCKTEILYFGMGSENVSKAYKLYEFTTSKNDFRDEILRNINNIAKGGYRNIKNFLEDIHNDNFEWKKYFHYLFLSYKSDGLDIQALKSLIENKIYSLQIEHILAKNFVENNLYKRYGFDNESEFDSLKDTFGNLLPLEGSLNSKCSDFDLVKKQSFYKESKVPYVRAFATDENFSNFNKNKIIEENNNFKKFAMEFFKEFLV